MTESATSSSLLDIHDPRDLHGSPSSPKNEAVFETLERRKSLTWNATLAVEATFDSAIFQRRSCPATLGPEGVDGPPRSAKAAGILRGARSCSIVSSKKAQLHSLLNGTAAIRMRTERLDRLLDRQIREEQAAERAGLNVDIGATINNVWDAVFVSPLLGLVGQFKTSTREDEPPVPISKDDGDPPKAPSTPRYRRL